MLHPTRIRHRRDPWDVYVPTGEAPWDRRRVVHLHRRAGFAATWDEVGRDLADGPAASVARLVAGRSRLRGVPEDFAAVAHRLAEAALDAASPARLKGWWVFRMLHGPDPLGERLTLMGHDHFATGNAKVDDLAAMHRQNELLRTHARGRFGDLLRAMVVDPALLTWLDAPENTREHPNENLARELMELFTLGVGHYAEDDVRQAARALTGWRIVDGRARFVAARHDPGPKTLLGRSGPIGLDGLVAALLNHPATANRLAWRLCRTFLGEGTVDQGAVLALGDGLRAHDLDLGWGAATILRSRLFHSAADLDAQVVDPAGFVVGSVRGLEAFDPAPSMVVLADWMARLGQDLFDPPNVGGWPGGRSWITTRSALGRANFAASLLGGVDVGLPAAIDPARLADQAGRAGDDQFFARLFLGTDAEPIPLADPDVARRGVGRLLASPAMQRS